MKKVIWIAIVLLALVGLYFLLTSGAPKIEPALEVGVIHPLDNIKGDPNAEVVIMEYSDFQCPACRSYYIVMRQIIQEYGDRIAFVYRHFPLTGIHANAEFAARAVEAAGEQGKFWEMHDLLFEKQSEWSNSANVSEIFGSYAKLLDLNTDQFNTDWRGQQVKNFVSAHRVHSLRSGLQGTPSFFINGKQIQNPDSLEQFRKIISEALLKE